jgi:hypothetical protein
LNVHDDGLVVAAWFCVCKLGGSLAGMNVSFVGVVVGESASALGEREGFVWKLSDSCHQHALHQVDTYKCFRMT